MKLDSYNDVLESLDQKKRKMHLLMGNGFSISYDSKIFSYNALSHFVDNIENDMLKKLFAIIKTKNFEQIMLQLDNFCELAKEFSSDKKLEGKVKAASELLKTSLLDAITALHPEHVYKIPKEKSQACAKFLNRFLECGGNIFTTNYDILLYWVLMRNSDTIGAAIDGFGRELENQEETLQGEDAEYSELIWGKNRDDQNIHYLHGALPIFDTGTEIVKEEYDGQNYILNNIKSRIEKNEYPVFVTAGDGQEKLRHIMHNQYLTNCYERLCSLDGSLITFGFNFGTYDEHIIDAINIAAKHGVKVPPKLWSIYIGVYSEADRKHIEDIKGKFKCKVNLYDATTVNIWNAHDA